MTPIGVFEKAMIPIGVFLITCPRHPDINVVVTANNREQAKRMAFSVLFGDMDSYVVTPITSRGKRTVFVTITESMPSK